MKNEMEKTWSEFFQTLTDGFVGQNMEHQDINDVFGAFYEFNPGINFGNKTYRKAAEWLVEHYGMERVLQVIKFVGQIRSMPYAPRISNPYQLKEKWADLESFALTEKNKVQKKGLKMGSISNY